MPQTFLNAFLWAQGAVSFGLGAYFFAMHIGVREWVQLPMVQAVLRKYSPRRLAFGRIYVRTFTIVMSLSAVVCIYMAGYNIYVTFATPEPHLARADELAGVTELGLLLLFLQIFLILMLFIQHARSRRAIRNMARSLQAQIDSGSVKLAAETSLSARYQSSTL